MSDEGMKQYFKDYQNCSEYCKGTYNTDEDEEIAKCILEIRSEYGEDMCKVEEVCPIIGTRKYIHLVLILKEVLRFIYTSRSKYENLFDAYLIPMVSSIPLDKLEITMEELSCIKFPGDASFVPGFPKTLSEYLILFNDLMNEKDTEASNIEGWTQGLTSKRKNMNSFINDFQPWTRTLSTFVRKHDIEIPLIEKPKTYGNFINSEYLTFMEDLQSKGLLKNKEIITISKLKEGHQQIIAFIMKKLPSIGGKSKHKHSRKTRNKRKSKTIKKRK